MRHGVIQGYFIGGARLAPPTSLPGAPVQRFAASGQRAMPGPPPPTFSPNAVGAVQRHVAPGRPPLVQPGRSAAASAADRHGTPGHTLQRFGGDGSFAVDPVQVGLVRNGGKPLPGPLLAKMEAALGADFSAVRIHVGPQASRIGALAFTTGNDLYFAPGQYQPDSVKGQQLIGHELAHVIQQRQGRVRAPGGGVAVVQDRALEAEADRLGMKAAIWQVNSTGAHPGSAVQHSEGRSLHSLQRQAIQRFNLRSLFCCSAEPQLPQGMQWDNAQSIGYHWTARWNAIYDSGNFNPGGGQFGPGYYTCKLITDDWPSRTYPDHTVLTEVGYVGDLLECARFTGSFHEAKALDDYTKFDIIEVEGPPVPQVCYKIDGPNRLSQQNFRVRKLADV